MSALAIIRCSSGVGIVVSVTALSIGAAATEEPDYLISTERREINFEILLRPSLLLPSHDMEAYGISVTAISAFLPTALTEPT